jgi:hypothetical protein
MRSGVTASSIGPGVRRFRLDSSLCSTSKENI